MKYTRRFFIVSLALWTLFCLVFGGAALLLDGPVGAFLIVWAAFGTMGLLTWGSVELGVFWFMRVFRRAQASGGGPIVITRTWSTGDVSRPGAGTVIDHDPWAHAPDYRVPSKRQDDQDDDEIPTYREPFPRL